MSIGEIVLGSMHEHDRSPGFLDRQCGVDVERLMLLITGQAAPTGEELEALAAAMGIEAHELAQSDEAPAVADVHPLRCYTVREVAALLQVSEDTVRKEMSTGALRYIVVGARASHPPRRAAVEGIVLTSGSPSTGLFRPLPGFSDACPMRRPESRQGVLKGVYHTSREIRHGLGKGEGRLSCSIRRLRRHGLGNRRNRSVWRAPCLMSRT